MRGTRLALCGFAAIAAGSVIFVAQGCGGGGSFLSLTGSPFPIAGQTTGTGTTGPGNTGGTTGGGQFGGNDRTAVDPCTEQQQRKFIRISMQNRSDSTIHYFLLLIAYVNSDAYPDGGVCLTDVPLYTAFGYVEVGDGGTREFGSYCIRGPALFYFHRAGQFHTAAGGALASAIPPAQGSSPTFDAFFQSAAPQVPVPDLILFHNPGTGEGAALKISRSPSAPCNPLSTDLENKCRQDAFYYVDENDLLAGSTQLGLNSGRRTPNEIQGTGCQCGLGDVAASVLAPSRVTANSARCNEFLRGGRIDYVFVRDDTNPPYPQLLWRVTDGSSALVHDFDSRANIP